MRVTRVFLDVDMRQSFPGLARVMAKASAGTPVDSVLFINRRMTAFKVMTDGLFITYYNNGNRRIPLDAIKFLPQSFGGTEIEMNQAIEKSLRSKLVKETQ
jgi:hypothetical protein